MLKWGVIGCGQIAFDKVMPAIAKATAAELTAVADVKPERLALAKEKFAAIKCYTDADELLAGDIDVVYIGLPNELHAPFVAQAAQAGKDVLCEKPLALNATEARAMAQICAQHNVKLMCAYMSRFSDIISEAMQVMAERRLGKTALIQASFSYHAGRAYHLATPGAWRWTGPRPGPLMDIGIYLLFAIRELQGSRFARISAAAHSVVNLSMPAPDTVVAWFILEDGTPGVLTTAFSHGGGSRISIDGEAGKLVLENCFAQAPSGTLTVTAGTYKLHRQTDTATLDHFDNYTREVDHFCAALMSGQTYRPEPAEAIADMAVLDAFYASFDSGRPVDIIYA